MNEIVEFKPSIPMLKKMASDYAVLKIGGATDEIGYVQVSNALKEIKEARIGLTKTAKEVRAEAVRIQKEVIKKEKEAKEIILPVEEMLAGEKNKIDNLSRIDEWIAKLVDVGAKISKKDLLPLSTTQFNRLYKEKQAEYLEAIKKENDKSEVVAEIDKYNKGKEKKFLDDNGFDKNTDIVIEKEGELRLYRIVNTLKL